MLLTIIEVGNFMNNGGRLKDATGYKMESIIKTADTKSPARKGITLLSYVVIHCQRCKPEALTLAEDLQVCLTQCPRPGWSNHFR